MKTSSIIFVALLSMMSCNRSSNEKTLAINNSHEIKSSHPGKKLMEFNCNVCHSPTASHDERLGPPMIAIKKHYIDSKTSKEDFKNSIQSWVNNPNEEDARMYGAVRRFGVMPKQSFPEETINLIADYLYDNDIEQPEWFKDHHKSKNGKGMKKRMHEEYKE